MLSANVVSPLEFIVDLLGPAALIGLGCYQLYLRKNVEDLDRQGKIAPETAIRIRKKPMGLIGWTLILSGTILLALKAFQLISK